MLRGDFATTAFQGYAPTALAAYPETRIGGSDQAVEGATGSGCELTTRTVSGWGFTYGEHASDRQVVTNLRLPGQYDERLFEYARPYGLGLQGPYYNWNRWYLPGVGRYLEPDPIALAGGFNGEFGPDWYSYANGNPLRWTDPWGLTFYPRRDDESAALKALMNNPVLGPLIQWLDDNRNVHIFFDAMPPGKADMGGLGEFVPGRPAQGCEGARPSVGHIYYNLADGQRSLREYLGLESTSLANLLAHEIGHFYVYQVNLERTGYAGTEQQSDLMSLLFEDWSRIPGPYRTRHDP